MIEVVYKNNALAAENRDNFRIPKNVTQIGTGNTKDGGDSRVKIYIENSVMEELEREEAGAAAGYDAEYTYGVLLGDLYYDDADYIFVRDNIHIAGNEMCFNDDVWREVYESIRERGEESRILGWYTTALEAEDIDFAKIRKIHLDNFAGNNKLFLRYDRQPGETGIYFYDHTENAMVRQNMYYIYWGNMSGNISGNRAGAHVGAGAGAQTGSQTKMTGNRETDKRAFGKIPRLLSRSERVSYGKMGEKPEPPVKKGEKTFGNISGFGKKLPWGSIAVIAVLAGTLIYMGNNGQLTGLRNRASTLVNNIAGGSEKGSGDYSFLDRDNTGINVSDINGNVSSSERETTIREADTTKAETVTTAQNTAPEGTENNTDKKPDESSTVQVSGTAGKYYTVKQGQNLFDIARENYKGDMPALNSKVREIVKMNNIKDPNKIYPGQKILLP